MEGVHGTILAPSLIGESPWQVLSGIHPSSPSVQGSPRAAVKTLGWLPEEGSTNLLL